MELYIQVAMLSYKLTQQKLNCCLVNWLLHGYYSYTSKNLVVAVILGGVLIKFYSGVRFLYCNMTRI